MLPPILILHAPGSNRDGDLARAFELAGGQPTIAPLTALQSGEVRWQDFALLALPGGFSYGDALGGGRLWALDLHTWFHDALQTFVESGKPVIGICNGFQALVKAGMLPEKTGHQPPVISRSTLTFNASGHFECRWVNLLPSGRNRSPWVAEDSPRFCARWPTGKGRLLLGEGQSIPENQIALVYANPDGSLAGGAYPANPNGSPNDIAGITNARGNVIGMMPHPEDHVYPHQHPAWTRGVSGGMGLPLFVNGVKFAAQV